MASGPAELQALHRLCRIPNPECRRFVEQVLPHARDVPVVIAQAGGWGGLDANTWDALEGFRQVLAGRPDTAPDLVFDLAQVFDADTSPENRARLVEVMRSIGVERFVVGSDWPFSGPLDDHLNDAMGLLVYRGGGSSTRNSLGRRRARLQLHRQYFGPVSCSKFVCVTDLRLECLASRQRVTVCVDAPRLQITGSPDCTVHSQSRHRRRQCS